MAVRLAPVLLATVLLALSPGKANACRYAGGGPSRGTKAKPRQTKRTKQGSKRRRIIGSALPPRAKRGFRSSPLTRAIRRGVRASMPALRRCFAVAPQPGYFSTKVTLSFTVNRRGSVRASPHFYNSEEEIDRLLGCL